jgi:uncharacterized protein YndB with AHSA1/START domain
MSNPKRICALYHRPTLPRMRTCSFEVTARSAAPPATVFAILADGANWSRWAGPLVPRSAWDRQGDPAPGGVGAIRKLGRWPVFAREEILEYAPPHHTAYTVVSAIPVRDQRAEIDLTADGAGTHIAWRSRFVPRIPGTGAVLEWVLAKMLGSFAHRLARYAEASPSLSP